MKFAQSSFLFFNYTLKDAIRQLHQCGYDGIEIWGGRPHLYRHDLDEDLDEIKALLESFKMSVPNMIPAQFRYPSILSSSNSAVRRDSVAYIKEAMDNALAIGAPSISLCAGMTLKGESIEQGWKNLRQSIIELLDYRAASKLNILIEPAHRWESTLILTVDDGLRMIKDIGSERLGICFDTGHAQVNGEDMAATVGKLKGMPLHIHIDDNNGDSDTHMIPGDGKIDLGAFTRTLDAMDYRGFVSAELGFQYTLDPVPAAARTYDALTSMFSTGAIPA